MVELGNILTGSGLIAIFGLLYKINSDTRKDTDGKIKRAYSRIDEVKEKTDKDYTRKDVCNVLHEQIRQDFTEVKSDLREIKTDIKSFMKKNGY